MTMINYLSSSLRESSNKSKCLVEVLALKEVILSPLGAMAKNSCTFCKHYWPAKLKKHKKNMLDYFCNSVNLVTWMKAD